MRSAKLTKHLHTGAFNLIRRLDKMKPGDLADFMEHFDHYFQASGLQERANSAPRLSIIDGPANENDDEFQEAAE